MAASKGRSELGAEVMSGTAVGALIAANGSDEGQPRGAVANCTANCLHQITTLRADDTSVPAGIS